MTCVIGVDPGLTGALALLDSYGQLLDVHDMPVMGKGVSARGVADIIRDFQTDIREVVCVIEDVHSMPKQGVASSFGFGRSKGVVEGAAAAAGLRIIYVTPALWKRQMKVTAKKGSSRDLATDRWPKFADQFKRVKDDGRAEAALIGLWQVQHG